MFNRLLNVVKAITITVILSPKNITTQNLFNKLRFNEVIEINKIWLENNMKNKIKFKKKGIDFFTRLNIAKAYAYLEKSDEGFEYIIEIVKKITSEKLIEEIFRYFIYPEFKKNKFHEIIYRCSYFSNENMSKKTRKKIDEIVINTKLIINGQRKMSEIFIEGKSFIKIERLICIV